MDVVLEYVKFPLTTIKLIGLWISPKSNALYLLYFVFIMATQYLFALFQIVYTISVLGDIAKTAEATYLLLTQATLCYKIYVFLTNIKTVRSLMRSMRRDKVFEVTAPEYLRLMEVRSTRCRRLFILFTNMSIMTIFFWAIFPLIDQHSDGAKALPFKAWYPIPKDRTPYYEVLYFYQIAGIIVSALINCSLDFLAISMMAFGQTQLEIVNDSFREISVDTETEMINEPENNTEKMDLVEKHSGAVKTKQESLEEGFYKQILDCVYRHQCTVDFLKLVEKTFHKNALAQMVASVVIICITGLQMVIMKAGSLEFVSMILYFMAMLFQIFLYCWQGNEVTVTSLNLVDAAYSCPWYILNRKANMVLFTFFERLRKPIVIRAGNFFPLSLQIFVSLLRSSYSYYAVLRQVQSE